MLVDEMRPIAASVDELIAGASEREPMKTADSLSGARFERLVIGGERYVLKHLHVDDDWIQRATGDIACRPLLVWRHDLLAPVSHVIDDAIVGAAYAGGRNGWGAALLLRDVSEHLVPEGGTRIALEDHARFIEHMAEMHATCWGWRDTIGLCPPSTRYTVLGPRTADIERAIGSDDPVPRMLPDGWAAFARTAPQAWRIVEPLLDDPTPLVAAQSALPSTFIHGDWKLGNLGSRPDGRTILLDWAFPGEGVPTADLAWYLAVNCDRMPESKQDAIDRYRAALESRGIDTGPWWEPALALSLLGAVLQLGWSKSRDELEWWADRCGAWSGRPGESHPRAPTDPYVTVSRHTALVVLIIGEPASPRSNVRGTEDSAGSRLSSPGWLSSRC